MLPSTAPISENIWIYTGRGPNSSAHSGWSMGDFSVTSCISKPFIEDSPQRRDGGSRLVKIRGTTPRCTLFLPIAQPSAG